MIEFQVLTSAIIVQLHTRVFDKSLRYAHGEIREDIIEVSGYANVVPHGAGYREPEHIH